MELKIEDLKYRNILVHKETGVEYEVMGFDSNGKEIIFSSGEVANDLKYFKKKEQSQYTFDDLIDVANDAVKNKLITQTRFSLSAIGTPLLIVVYFDGREGRYTDDNLLNGIEFIQSLYKETFVIESEEDLKRIKVSAEITLANGIKSIAQRVYQYGESKITIKLECCTSSMEFAAFKGATVTQSK